VVADIAAICRKAAMAAVRAYVAADGDADLEKMVVTAEHFDAAIAEVRAEAIDTRSAGSADGGALDALGTS
jgi:SpoVK/Ycf46/Vps4 family AAA+-type ATPase